MHDYRWSNDWFQNTRYGKRGTLAKESTQQLFERLLVPMAQAGGCRRILELGLAEGRSSIWFMENLMPELWVGIDAWQWGRQNMKEYVQKQEKNFWHNMRELAAAQGGTPGALNFPSVNFAWWDIGNTKCQTWKKLSQQWLIEDADDHFDTFDLIYLDGDHTGPGTILDAVLCWRKLAIGGIMIFDDFDRRWHNARPCTHEAVLAFWSCHEHFAEKVFENRFQFWIRKKAQ